MLGYLLGFIKNGNGKNRVIKTKTLQDFIETLKKRNSASSVYAEIYKEITGCLEFEKNGRSKEIFTYFVEFSFLAKNEKGQRIIFLEKYKNMIEPAGDVFESKNFLNILEVTKSILLKIKKESFDSRIYLIVPEEEKFISEDYKNIMEKFNELPSFLEGVFL